MVGHLERFLRRGAVAMGLGATLLAALFVARGVNALIEAALVVPPRTRRRPPPPPVESSRTWPEDVVVARNLFDSLASARPETRPAPGLEGDLGRCARPARKASFALAGVATASEPEHALAAFRIDGRLLFGRLGDEVGEWLVVEIHDHWVCLASASELVWVDLFDPPAPAPRPRKKGPGRTRSPEFAAHVEKLGPGRWAIDGPWLDELVRSGKAARMGRLAPRLQEGRMTGLKVGGLRSNGPLHELGLRNGDVLTSANGRALDSVRAGLDMLEELAGAREVVLAVERRGRRLELRFDIR